MIKLLFTQARSKAKTAGGGGGGGASKLVKQSPPSHRHSKNRPIKEFEMQQEHKKGVDLVSKTITLHLHRTFWYISLPSLYADYHVKLPNFKFEGGRKKTTTNFLFSFSVNLVSGGKNPSVGEFD